MGYNAKTNQSKKRPESRGPGGKMQIPGMAPWWKEWVKVREAVFQVIVRYPDVHREVMDSMRNAGVIDDTR
jgi:hypothetical protein